MKLADIFEIDDPVCIEPALSDHPEDGYTGMAASMESDEGRLLVDENEEPIAAAFHDDKGWLISSFIYRPFSVDIIEKIESCEGEIYQEKRDVYIRSIREYYCDEIVREFPFVTEDNRPGRYEMIESLFDDIKLKKCGKTALDFCCGSGVATSVLSAEGYETLSFDYDASLLSLGIQQKRLIPEKTMCIDGADASLFCEPADLGIGLMLGDITNFNADMWENIVHELLSLSKISVISVATGPEIEKVAGWCQDAGRKPDIIQNDIDPIYDAWVCYSEEK
ncbi:MAG: hypothetical protein JXQ82_08765 [Methanomicrobiaceae archaeon]|nr:hypothetical protein [Methanomicrobiaceae archaeon]